MGGELARKNTNNCSETLRHLPNFWKPPSRAFEILSSSGKKNNLNLLHFGNSIFHLGLVWWESFLCISFLSILGINSCQGVKKMVKLPYSVIKTATSHFVRLTLQILSSNLLDCMDWNKRNKEDMLVLTWQSIKSRIWMMMPWTMFSFLGNILQLCLTNALCHLGTPVGFQTSWRN